MKKLILYVMMMGIAIAINSCEPVELYNLSDLNTKTCSLSDGWGLHMVYFSSSLNKTRYKTGEIAEVRVCVTENYPDTTYCYDGKITIAGNEHYLFRKEVIRPDYELVPWVLDFIVETAPGKYNATFTYTRFTYAEPSTITKKVQIPYEVR